jgi:pyruvate ferredoxin oxidoreductase beta subunit/phenylglyoxylate dehydrogenase beta subunit
MKVIDKLATFEDMVAPGVSACVGCNVELTLRTVTKILGPNTILAVPPGCVGGVGVVGWDKMSGAKIPVFFPLLDNTASMLAGIRLGYNAKGRDVNVVAFAGDGATVDAGFQALSGAAERGDRITYICYDNEGYMNTGYQRSSSTSKYAWTSTTPVSQAGKGGKSQDKKDIALIMAMHDIPYMATASPAFIPDLVRKVETAMAVKEGLAYIHVYNPCPTGWGIKPEESIEICRLAVKSRFFPLYESRYRDIKITHRIKNPIPVSDYISRLKKFEHLTPEQVEETQQLVDRRYRFLEAIAGI